MRSLESDLDIIDISASASSSSPAAPAAPAAPQKVKLLFAKSKGTVVT
jgi:hypothetical protein